MNKSSYTEYKETLNLLFIAFNVTFCTYEIRNEHVDDEENDDKSFCALVCTANLVIRFIFFGYVRA